MTEQYSSRVIQNLICPCTEDNKIQFLEDEPEPAKEEVKEEVIPKPGEVDSDAELENELQVVGSDVIDPSRPISTAELLASREEALRKRRLLIGVLASGLLENPQMKVFLEQVISCNIFLMY
jgi:hypothetical protein